MFWLCALAGAWQAFAAAELDEPRSNTSPWLAGFQDPPAVSRAKFRYWLPDASVDSDTVQADIRSAGSVGAGGVEFLPFYNYGGELPSYPTGADWSKYGFGTPAYKKLLQAALEAHAENDLVMDFSLGPNQGQGVPADKDDQGLQWDLIPFKVNISSDGSFKGQAPGWGEGHLVSLVSASIVSSRNISFEAMDQLSPINATYEQMVLRSGSFIDHTSKVRQSGHVSLEFDTDDKVALFAFYERLSQHKALLFPSNKSVSIFDDGAYVVDHFSARGAQTVTDFWEEYILDSNIEQLLRSVGDYGWEDSPEVRSNISWTPTLPSRFADKFGYDLKLQLPLVAFRQNNLGLQPAQPGSFECLLDTPDQGVAVSNDFRAALQDGYTEYLDGLRQWTRDRLSLGFSSQPGYNLPVDMMAVLPHVDIPECESLGFRDNVDGYLQFSGPAQVAGRRKVSNELGAIFDEAWRYSLSTLVFSANRAFAGGVNRMVLHGQGYTGNYYETTWPGYAAFLHLVTESWTNKQPAWDHGMRHVMDYIARIQHVLQNSVPQVDIAIYHKKTGTNFTDVYLFDDLPNAGWSYNYLTSESLFLPDAEVGDGVLSPNGPAYNAFVVPTDQNLTVAAIQRLFEYAADGLPIIFTGNSSQAWYFSAGPETEEQMKAELKSLLASENVYLVEEAEAANQLAALGLVPRAKTVTNGTWHTVSSHTPDAYFVWIFCDSAGSEGEIIVKNTKQPYILDAWTGAYTPIVTFDRKGDTTVIPLSLSRNQTMLIAFTDELPKPRRTLSTSTVLPNILGTTTRFARSQLHMAHTDEVVELRLSDGKNLTIDTTSVAKSMELSNWHLVAEHWEAPKDMYDVTTIARKRNTTHEMETLASWLEVPALANVSGVGYYTTTFNWPPATGKADGAYISFPPVDHAMLLRVNGEAMHPLDYARPTADISKFLVEGDNNVEVIVPTTMWNYIKTIAHDIEVSGSPHTPAALEEMMGIPMPSRVNNGLVGSVKIIPIKCVKV
ncbi:hypothetical protein LCI18_006927 [Fusarium solani-melongenae]|uniref:Uncharacterized protein n=1 Tax=Fusarium solani subsp. cucurbitae TaxID=2747967 RepID=A0ACD3Z4G4_FUSSC|nr:hypothetical protein LCI18_006927 [Fusarium solani-melongenae]